MEAVQLNHLLEWKHRRSSKRKGIQDSDILHRLDRPPANSLRQQYISRGEWWCKLCAAKHASTSAGLKSGGEEDEEHC